MASLRWKNYSACLALLLERVSCLPSRRPLLPMLPPNPYLQMSEVPTETLKQTGLRGLLPLLPLTKDGARQEVVDEMITELVVAGEKDLLALSQLLGALAFKPETTKKWFRKRFTVYNDIIEESWVYQEWMAQAHRQTLLHIVQARFPEIMHLAKKQAE